MADKFNIEDLGLPELLEMFDKLKKKINENAEAMSGATKKMTETNKKYIKSVTDIDGRINKLTKDITELKNKQGELKNKVKAGKITQDEYNREIAETSHAISRANNDRKKYINIIQSEIGSIKRAKAENAIWRRERNEMGKITNKNKKQLEDYNKRIDKNTRIIKKNVDAQSRSYMSMNKLSGAFRNLGAAMGVTMGIYGIFRVLKNAVRIISRFSLAMSKLQAVSGATAEEIKRLEKDALRLGRTTQKTASEVASLQFELAKLGFTTKQILAATEAILNLSIASGGDLAQSAEIAGSTVRAFGLAASETQRVVDVMAKSFSTSGLNLERFGASMPNVGATAKAFGWTLEKTTAILGLLISSGIQASKAGTDLRKIITELAKSGLTLNEALDKIRKSQNQVVTAQEMFDQRAYTSAIILANLGDRVDEYTGSLDRAYGSSEKMRQIMEDNLIGDVNKLKSAWEGFILALKNSEGVLRATIQQLTAMVTVFRLVLTPKDERLLDVTYDRAKRNIDIWAKSLQQLKLSTKEYNNIIDEQLEYFESELNIYEQIARHSEQNDRKVQKRAEITIAYLKNMIELTQKLRKEAVEPAPTEEEEGAAPAGSIEYLNDKIKEYTKLMKEATDPNVILYYKNLIKTYKRVKTALENIGEPLKDLIKPRKVTGKPDEMEMPEFPEPTGFKAFWIRLLGLTPEQKGDIKEALQRYVRELQAILTGLTNAMVDYAQGQVSASEQILSNLYNQLDEEKKAREDGKASNIQLLETQIAEEKKIRDKAQKDLEKAQKAQQAVNTAMELSSLTVASANIIKAFSALGIPGLVLGIAAVTSLVSWYTAMKVKMAALTKEKYAEGEIDIDGKPHSRGGKQIEIEGGESVINKRATKKHKKLLKAINDGTIDELYKWNFYNGVLPDMAQKNLTGEVIEQLKRQEQVQQNTLDYLKQKAEVVPLGEGKYMIIKGYKKEVVTVK